MDEYEDLIPTRASLLSRLKCSDDSESWRVCFETYWKLIFNAARRAGLTEAEAEDVVQETLLTVARTIHDFTYNQKQGSFKGWLLKTTAWRVQDQFRKRASGRLEFLADLPESIHPVIENGVQQLWDSEWEQNLLSTAIERVKKQVSAKHFQIFDLAVIRQWSTARISAELGVNSSYVYITKHRVNNRFKAELATLRRQTE
jgi:RNA polymerase sigma-70 factor (ECF subfamily)